MRALLLSAIVVVALSCTAWQTKTGLTDISGAAVTDAFAIASMNWHNYYRCVVYSANAARVTGVPLEAKWSPTVAATAQNYVNQCYWGHNVAGVPYGTNSYGYGENLHMGISNTAFARNAAIAQAAATNWYNEYTKFNTANPPYSPSYACLPSSPASMSCGHYTQMMWTVGTRVRQIGCGFKNCAGMKNYAYPGYSQYGYVACRYSPPGNVLVTTRGVLATSAVAETEGEIAHAGGTIEIHHHDNSLVGVVAVLAVVAIVAVVVAVATIVRRRRSAAPVAAVDETELLA